MIDGFVEAGFGPVRDAFVANFERRGELGAACAAYHRGIPVVDLGAATGTRGVGSHGTRTRW